MQILDEAPRELVTVPNDMEADCCFTYEGRPLFHLGGIFPGDLICIRFADDGRADVPVAVNCKGNAVLCLRRRTESGDVYFPVNPEKCRSHHQPYYVTNEKIQAYTDLLIPLAEEKRVVYVDVAAALTGGTGVLPGELTSDGVHFTRSGYVQWLDYLKTHTVDAAAYQAGQAATQQLDEKGTDEI